MHKGIHAPDLAEEEKERERNVDRDGDTETGRPRGQIMDVDEKPYDIVICPSYGYKVIIVFLRVYISNNMAPNYSQILFSNFPFNVSIQTVPFLQIFIPRKKNLTFSSFFILSSFTQFLISRFWCIVQLLYCPKLSFPIYPYYSSLIRPSHPHSPNPPSLPPIHLLFFSYPINSSPSPHSPRAML